MDFQFIMIPLVFYIFLFSSLKILWKLILKERSKLGNVLVLMEEVNDSQCWNKKKFSSKGFEVG